jgi:hypothetical protein
MPQNQKANVNNLVVVWQGQSWSVVAPDGKVLFRHWSKDIAMDWASQNFQYAPGKNLSSTQTRFRKAKAFLGKLRSILGYVVVIALIGIVTLVIAIGGYVLVNQVGTTQTPESIVPHESVEDSENETSNQEGFLESVANQLSQVNWFGLIVFGLVVLGLVSLLKELADQGCESLLIGGLVIGAGLFICNACGLLNLFLNWVF